MDIRRLKKPIIIAIVIIIILIALVLIIPTQKSDETSPLPEENLDTSEYLEPTNDVAFEEYHESIDSFLSNYPIYSILPIRNENPFYYITIRADRKKDSDEFIASIEISYRDDAGKEAAESRLRSADLATYHPENLPIQYNQLKD